MKKIMVLLFWVASCFILCWTASSDFRLIFWIFYIEIFLRPSTIICLGNLNFNDHIMISWKNHIHNLLFLAAGECNLLHVVIVQFNFLNKMINSSISSMHFLMAQAIQCRPTTLHLQWSIAVTSVQRNDNIKHFHYFTSTVCRFCDCKLKVKWLNSHDRR